MVLVFADDEVRQKAWRRKTTRDYLRFAHRTLNRGRFRSAFLAMFTDVFGIDVLFYVDLRRHIDKFFMRVGAKWCQRVTGDAEFLFVFKIVRDFDPLEVIRERLSAGFFAVMSRHADGFFLFCGDDLNFVEDKHLFFIFGDPLFGFVGKDESL